MRILLNLPDASADWRGLAHVISKSGGLRDDVTLVVEQGRLRFFDAECREIQTGLDSARWMRTSTLPLSAKISLLDWLYERFPQADEEAAPTQQKNRLAASYFSREAVETDTHWASSQSTS